jgi:hypothetical protein
MCGAFRASCPDYLTVHKDRVVVFIDGEDAAVHIDPATNRVTKRVKMPASSSGFYRLYGEVPWVMTDSGLAQVDLDSGRSTGASPAWSRPTGTLGPSAAPRHCDQRRHGLARRQLHDNGD